MQAILRELPPARGFSMSERTLAMLRSVLSSFRRASTGLSLLGSGACFRLIWNLCRRLRQLALSRVTAGQGKRKHHKE
jgi:hypothetical protein